MSDRSIPLIDRLRERGLIDRWGFLAFTFVGGAGILIAKVVEVPAEWVAIGASAIILRKDRSASAQLSASPSM